jgi:hypothetical protein
MSTTVPILEPTADDARELDRWFRELHLSCRAFSFSSQRSVRTTAIAMVRRVDQESTWNEPTFTVW